MNISNKQTILLFSLSTLMMNGCLSKHELKTVPVQSVMSHSVQTQPLAQTKSSWGNVKHVVNKKTNQHKVACVNCYAAPINYSQKRSVAKRGFSKSLKKPSIISYSYYDAPVDYSKPPSALSNSFEEHYQEKKVSPVKHYGRYAYTEKPSDKMLETEHYARKNTNKYLLPVVSTMNNAYSSYDSFSNSSNTSIQVGAFRNYSGATRYVRRYSALSNKYKVVIKTGTKDNQPIYRVRIEGFKNQREAKNFMNVYGIQDAFLVRR